MGYEITCYNNLTYIQLVTADNLMLQGNLQSHYMADNPGVNRISLQYYQGFTLHDY